MIVALPTLVVIAAVFGLIYLQHRDRRKASQVDMEYMHFDVRVVLVVDEARTNERRDFAPSLNIATIFF